MPEFILNFIGNEQLADRWVIRYEKLRLFAAIEIARSMGEVSLGEQSLGYDNAMLAEELLLGVHQTTLAYCSESLLEGDISAVPVIQPQPLPSGRYCS